eukprot:5077241-Pyramimonas_sp.AAC.1
METKRVWAAMSAHTVKGFMDPTSGYVKQLKSASQGIGSELETDLAQPTAVLVEHLVKLAEDLNNMIDKIGERCAKLEFVKHVKTIDSFMTELDGQRKH